ncbi:GTPase IMAP family member 8-like [Chanos chanos]|uniref:GTPase IMAP family member 8-like n=1 Tax=Chanos chanos TaxID=29144 RepID=A0A6J2UMZ1_CHACN|nr:GTPase IMAP family member 8-like [Chanos chanos]
MRFSLHSSSTVLSSQFPLPSYSSSSCCSCSCYLRVVLLGGKLSGKSSVINTVCGENIINTYSRTGQCRKYQTTVNGKEITLVDTPGWWKHSLLKETAECLKQELVHSVTLCPPGPHALLLVIELDMPFTEKHRKSMEEHLQLLGGGVWAYTMILFTRKSYLRYRNIEEHIENEGEALQWLIQKCEGRYHVFENENQNNDTQVTELLEKIQGVRAQNSGGCFQIDQNILETAEGKREIAVEKSASRQRKAKKQRKLNKNELRIALLGWVMAGKSSAANTILNTDEFVTGRRTMKCKGASGEVSGRKVTVLDTPSWWKFLPSHCTPEWVKSEILQEVTKSPELPHAILLVIPGDTSFKERQRKIIVENMEMFGENVWRHIIVLFTWSDALGDMPIERHIESEGKALQWVVNKCGNRYHTFDNMNKRNRSQVTELLEKIEEMVERNSSFQFSTEIETEVYDADEDSDKEIDSKTDLCGDETSLKDLVRLLDQEWNRRDDEFLKKLEKIWRENIPTEILIRKGNQSMDDGPYLKKQ